MKSNTPTSTQANAKEIVLSCVKALNEEDFKTARKYVSDNFSFAGVPGFQGGAGAYFDDMKKMKLKTFSPANQRLCTRDHFSFALYLRKQFSFQLETKL